MNKIDRFLLFLLVLLIVSSILYYMNMMKTVKDTFITYGDYSDSVTKPLLYGDYPLKKEVKLSNITPEIGRSYKPVLPSSYLQTTNNIRHWGKPDNGTCRPSTMCETLYDEKDVVIPEFPKLIPFSSNQTRVNMYDNDNI